MTKKQSRVDLLEKKVQALINVGTLETVKLMPKYDEAIEQLKEKAREDSSEEQKLDSVGEDSI